MNVIGSAKTEGEKTIPAYEFRPVPLFAVATDRVQTYFQTLAMHDTLKFRFSDLADPQWLDVVKVIQRMGKSMYLVEDQNNDIVAEFALESFTGKAAQIHFSTHPDNGWPKSLRAATEVSEQVLFRWKEFDGGGPYLHTLVGLTPVSNRPACITVLKAGFKKVGVIPDACYIARHGRYEDAMLTVKTSKKEVAHG